jgi:hypothetical protein
VAFALLLMAAGVVPPRFVASRDVDVECACRPVQVKELFGTRSLLWGTRTSCAEFVCEEDVRHGDQIVRFLLADETREKMHCPCHELHHSST